MLPKNQVVEVRRVLEQSYCHKCSIWEKKKAVQTNHATAFEHVMVQENCPCKLSLLSHSRTDETKSGRIFTQKFMVFLSPDIPVATGSKFAITQNGTTVYYTSNGEPSIFPTHQEIRLHVAERWA